MKNDQITIENLSSDTRAMIVAELERKVLSYKADIELLRSYNSVEQTPSPVKKKNGGGKKFKRHFIGMANIVSGYLRKKENATVTEWDARSMEEFVIDGLGGVPIPNVLKKRFRKSLTQVMWQNGFYAGEDVKGNRMFSKTKFHNVKDNNQ
jgi:hypothetical protein